MLWLCLFYPGQLALVLSKGLLEANEMLRRIRALYERLPEDLRAALPALAGKDNTRELGWSNGSRVMSLAASESAGVSFTASIVVMDEAARMRAASKAFASVKPTIDAGGRLVLLSTANGIGEFFHNIFSKAEQGLSGFTSVFLPWWGRPGRDRAWYEKVLAEAEDPGLVRQDYPGNPVEAFLSSSRTRFAPEAVAAQLANVLDPLWLTDRHHGRPTLGPGGEWPVSLLARYGWPGMPPGEIPLLPSVPGLSVYRPPAPGRSYVIGADVAEGLEEGDWCHGVVLDAGSWDEVACLHGRWEPDVYADYLMALSEPYRAAAVVERNNHGHAVLGRMKRCHFPRVADGEDGRPGWYTTVKNKPEGASYLSEALNKGSVTVRSLATVHEMQVFSRLPGGRLGAPAGYHDDRVMAWMAALGYVRGDRVARDLGRLTSGRNPLDRLAGRR